MNTEVENQKAGIPVFKDKKVNNGWILNIVKNNSIIMTTSLYDDADTFIESMAFNTQIENDLEIFRKYVEYFEDNPKNNLQKMLKLRVRIK